MVNGIKSFAIGLKPGEYQEILDADGAPANEYADWKTVWAITQIGSGREYFGARRNLTELDGLIKIRYLAGITSDMRVVVDGQEYEINSPPIVAGEKTWDRSIELHVNRVM